MAKRLHNTQIEECLKHYKHMDLLRHKQLFYMFIHYCPVKAGKSVFEIVET